MLSLRRDLCFILILFAALCLTGCFESKQDITLNPDGSGKMILEAWIDTSAQIQLGPAKSDAAAMESAVKEIIQKSEGIDAWKDVTFNRGADGRVYFKGTGYFKDLSRVKIQNYGTEFWWTKEGKTMSVQMKEETEAKSTAESAPLSDEQIQAQIKQARTEWKRMRCLMESVLLGMKKDAVLHVSGKVTDVNNFTKQTDNTLQVSFDGAKMMEVLDQMMSDEEWMKEQARSGGLKDAAGGGPQMSQAMNAKFFGHEGPVQAKVQLGKPLFDYKKESAAALKAYPKLLETLGIGTKAVASSVVKEGIQFQAGEVHDSRTNGEFFGGLDLELVMTGDIVNKTRAIRNMEIQKAVDSTGQTLLSEDSPGFQHSSKGEEEGKRTESLHLKNPARSATSITEISGTLELYVPDKDPKAKLLVKGVLKQSGKPLVSDVLKKAKIEIVVLNQAQFQQLKESASGWSGEGTSPIETALPGFAELFEGLYDVGENDLAFLVKDSSGRFAEIEVVDATGKRVPTNGHSFSGTTYTFTFEALPPDTSQLAVYLDTPTALVKAPFSLTNITLP